jgi:outer membrane lipoprotein LolB
MLVAGCASAPYAPTTIPAPPDEAFAIDGRLSAKRGRDAVSLGFTWTHASPRDELVVSTPLGQAVAELTSDASVPRIEVRTADGGRDEAKDWATLTERAVGFALPIDALTSWVRAAPRPGAAHTAAVDGAGRIDAMRQDGCEIVYAYADAAARRPSRVSLVCHDLELRLVIDRWRAS